jgi:hypothetical protein
MFELLATMSKISKRLQQVVTVVAWPGILTSYNTGLETGPEHG